MLLAINTLNTADCPHQKQVGSLVAMSEALRPCCDPSAPTAIWEGNPTGSIIECDGIETYLVKPKDVQSRLEHLPLQTHLSSDVQPSRVILFLTEGHGIYLPNAQLLADSFASHLDCDVIMPDQFAGQARPPQGLVPSFPTGQAGTYQTVPWTEDKDDPNYELRGLPLPLKENVESSDAYPFLKPPGWKESGPKEFEEWKMRHETPVTDPILARIVSWVHKTYGKDTKIGGAGYCFGGRYVMRLMGSGVIDVGVVNHPSFYTMGEVRKLGKGKKLAIFAAEKDDILPAEKRRETEDVLTTSGATWMSTVYSGTEHGFSVRGDLSNKIVRLAKERAFCGAVGWFRDWL